MQRAFIHTFFTTKDHVSTPPVSQITSSACWRHEPDSLPGHRGTRDTSFCCPGITHQFVSAQNLFHIVSSYQGFVTPLQVDTRRLQGNDSSQTNCSPAFPVTPWGCFDDIFYLIKTNALLTSIHHQKTLSFTLDLPIRWTRRKHSDLFHQQTLMHVFTSNGPGNEIHPDWVRCLNYPV